MPSLKPISFNIAPNQWDELIHTIEFAFQDVYHLLDYALGRDGKGVTIKLEHGGLGEDVSGYAGLVQITGGEANEISIGLGLKIDSNSLQVKQQAHQADVSEISGLLAGAGSDTLNISTFNTALATLVTEINAVRSSHNALIKALEDAQTLAST